MKFSTSLVKFGSVGDLALELKKALTAIAAGWNVEHNPDGTHKASVTGVRLHAPTHSSGGSDPVTVTTLAGYPGTSTTFLRGDHTFAAPTGTTPAAHHTTHEQGGSDVVTFTTGVFERGRSAAMGDWTAVPFNAAHFAGSGSMTWTVTAGQVTTNRYTLIGQTLVWQFAVQATSLSGTPADHVRVTVPGGFSLPVFSSTVGQGYSNPLRLFQVQGSGTTLDVYRQDNSNYVCPDTLFFLYFCLMAEIS